MSTAHKHRNARHGPLLPRASQSIGGSAIIVAATSLAVNGVDGPPIVRLFLLTILLFLGPCPLLLRTASWDLLPAIAVGAAADVAIVMVLGQVAVASGYWRPS